LTQRAFCPTCQRFVYLDPSDSARSAAAAGTDLQDPACPACSVPLLAVTDDGEDDGSALTAAS
jgi:uncharacterized Zn finger protein (UPF0148 family)